MKLSRKQSSLADELFVGLDVHKEKIAVAIAAGGRDGEIRFYGSINNTPDALAKLMKKLSASGATLHVCYEAAPCGYGIYRQVSAAAHRCDVVAPSLIPKATGGRIKTDRRDAIMLAKLHRAGELTSVWVPPAESCRTHEAVPIPR